MVRRCRQQDVLVKTNLHLLRFSAGTKLAPGLEPPEDEMRVWVLGLLPWVNAGLNVSFHEDDTFDITVDGVAWLSGGGVGVRSGGSLLSSWEGTLKPSGSWASCGSGPWDRGQYWARPDRGAGGHVAAS